MLFPHLHEVIVVDVALMIVGTDAGTSRYAAICQYRTDSDACLTAEEMVANVTFVVAKKTLAAVVGMDSSLLARLSDELENAAELFVGKAHLRVVGGTSYREYGEQAPVVDTLADKIFLECWQLAVVATMDASDDVCRK